MTDREFNHKYKDHIEDRFYGLEFNIPPVAEFLDKEFEKYIEEHPDFQFSQIKLKFGMMRIYTNAPGAVEAIWERKCQEIVDEYDKTQDTK